MHRLKTAGKLTDGVNVTVAREIVRIIGDIVIVAVGVEVEVEVAQGTANGTVDGNGMNHDNERFQRQFDEKHR
jgi:hypothetical protein